MYVPDKLVKRLAAKTREGTRRGKKDRSKLNIYRSIPYFDRSILNSYRSIPYFDRSILNFYRSIPYFDRSILNSYRSISHFDRSILNFYQSISYFDRSEGLKCACSLLCPFIYKKTKVKGRKSSICKANSSVKDFSLSQKGLYNSSYRGEYS